MKVLMQSGRAHLGLQRIRIILVCLSRAITASYLEVVPLCATAEKLQLLKSYPKRLVH